MAEEQWEIVHTRLHSLSDATEAAFQADPERAREFVEAFCEPPEGEDLAQLADAVVAARATACWKAMFALFHDFIGIEHEPEGELENQLAGQEEPQP
jgi:hypothetical protein